VFKIELKPFVNNLIRILLLKRFFRLIDFLLRPVSRLLNRTNRRIRRSFLYRRILSSGYFKKADNGLRKNLKNKLVSVFKSKMPTSNDNSTDGSENTSNQRPSSTILQNKIELALAATRAITIICTFFYVVPLFSRSVQYSAYQKALLANAATSALRLHQRIPNFRLNFEFFNMLMFEDSAHYLFYSLLFIFSRQITMVLLPIFLFALLHLLSFILRVMNEKNLQGQSYHRILQFIEKYKNYIFQMIALGKYS